MNKFLKKVSLSDFGIGGFFIVLLFSAPFFVSAQTQPGFVGISGNQLTLDGSVYFDRGANYFGGRYISRFIMDGAGVEYYNQFQIFHDFSESGIETELQLLKNTLKINTIRILLPSRGDFLNFVTYHNWDSWFMSDGSINPIYLNRLITLLAIANRNGIKVQMVLLPISQYEWKCLESGVIGACSKPLENYNASTAFFIPPGSSDEKFYLTYLDSLIPALKDNPAILSYEVGNEMLLYAPLNYWQEGWYDQKTLSFIKRIIREIRKLDSNHLITDGEVVYPLNSPYNTAWGWPTPELAQIPDIDNLNGGQPFSIYSIVDYISPHSYSAVTDYSGIVQAVKSRSAKPIVIGETGFAYSPENEAVATPPDLQQQYWQVLVSAIQQAGISGMQAWDPLPIFDLKPGTYRLDSFAAPWNSNLTLLRLVLYGPPQRQINYSIRWKLLDYNLALLPAGVVFAGGTPLPVATITAPVNGTTVSGTVAITVNASAGSGVAKVEFYVDGVLKTTVTGLLPYTYNWDTTTTSNGSHTLTVTARDAVGNTTTSNPVTVTMNNPVDTTLPNDARCVASTIPTTMTTGESRAVSIAFLNTGTRPWTADAIESATGLYATALSPYPYTTGTSIIPKDLSLPRAPITKGQTATFNFTMTAPTTSGTYVASYRMLQQGVEWFGDTCGLPALQVTSPTVVSITTPTNTSTVSGSIPVSATASDSIAVAGVQFKLDNSPLQSEDTTSPYSINWDTATITNGSHTLTATARDAAGNQTTSAAITVTVNNPIPTFDFSLTNGGSKSVIQSMSVTNTITASLVSGTSQSTSFSISGLPLGATATYWPPSCTSTCTSTLTITTLTTTPIGTYTVITTGTAESLTHTTSFILTISALSTSPSPVACTDDLKYCSDGSYVRRVAPGCNFTPCPILTPPPSFSYTFTRNLRYGMNNDPDVRALQIALKNESIFSIAPTGNFYSITLNSVRRFQIKYGISATGFVGPLTRDKLNKLYARQ